MQKSSKITNAKGFWNKLKIVGMTASQSRLFFNALTSNQILQHLNFKTEL